LLRLLQSATIDYKRISKYVGSYTRHGIAGLFFGRLPREFSLAYRQDAFFERIEAR
jgi:hypothetical protein